MGRICAKKLTISQFINGGMTIIPCVVYGLNKQAFMCALEN